MTDKKQKFIKVSLYVLGTYLLITSAIKLWVLGYVYSADTSWAREMQEVLSRFDALSIWLDLITYGSALIGGVLMYLHKRATIWLFLVAFIGKLFASLYNTHAGPGLGAINAEWVMKAMVAWLIFLATVVLAWLHLHANRRNKRGGDKWKYE